MPMKSMPMKMMRAMTNEQCAHCGVQRGAMVVDVVDDKKQSPWPQPGPIARALARTQMEGLSNGARQKQSQGPVRALLRDPS